MNEQNRLNEVYADAWDRLTEFKKVIPELSGPLLINIPSSYLSQKTRLMIIGQQTQGWSDGNISEQLSCYKKFNFGENYYATPFWNITRKIQRALTIDEFSIVWSNLNRCDFDGARPPHSIEKKLISLSSILTSEIEILKPDVVIFFSGPNFDWHISNNFNNPLFSTIQGFSGRELSRVEHKLLPKHTYKTYHPRYLRQSGIEPRFIEFIENIKA